MKRSRSYIESWEIIEALQTMKRQTKEKKLETLSVILETICFIIILFMIVVIFFFGTL